MIEHTYPMSEEAYGDLICARLMLGIAISREDADLYDRQMGKHQWRPYVDPFGREGLTAVALPKE